MGHLILLRHAKAVATSPAGDHARALSSRGLAEALAAGEALGRSGGADFALVSDARRTRETFDRVVEGLGQGMAHRVLPALYGATPDAILALVAEAPPEARRLLVVGHNPGIGDLARRLAAPGDPAVRRDLDAHFPTSAFALIRLAGAGWAEAGQGGTLDDYQVPDARART